MSLMTCAMSPCCASMAILVLEYDRCQLTPLTRKKAQTYPLLPSRADSRHLSLNRISGTAEKDQIRPMHQADAVPLLCSKNYLFRLEAEAAL
jgi:hypothetical protein